MKNRFIAHIGTPRHSGRYPWGSGEDPYQHSGSFLDNVNTMRRKGLSEAKIAEALGISTTELRARKSIELNKKRAADAAFAYRLKEKGYSNVAIGKRMGLNESSVRALLDPAMKEKAKITEQTASMLKANVEDKGFIDVGAGVEARLSISRTKLDVAIAMLKEQGYEVYNIPVEQMGTGKYTWTKALCPPGTTYSEVSKNQDKIKNIGDYSEDGGLTFKKPGPPISINGQRVLVRYKEDGGIDKDGVLELRRNVDDISLGNLDYAQVRVAVDGKQFMKGMAMYSDNIPEGYDIIYNTSKPRGTPLEKVFKPMEGDPDYPFGSVVRQKMYKDKDGNEQQSVLNIVGSKEGTGEEGGWETWSRNLSSQVLSKQTPALAKKQLGLTYGLKKEEFDEIMSLTNPAVQQALLKPFADSCDSAAVHLKAAALPGQATHVILPITSLKPNEIYARNYPDGENVILIRHPHGGVFEIPEVVVNNKNLEARRLLGDAPDAIGIHPAVAQRLSGADFDGDTVIVIPNKSGAIKTAPAIKSLKNFNPREAFPGYEGMHIMDDKREKGIEMGKISNLITDMTIKGADFDEIARAVRHSMVVIDAPKHKLNYQLSYEMNGIAALKEKYQGSAKAGASTLISRAGAEIRVNERQERRRLKEEPVTGERLFKLTGRTFFRRKYTVDEKGNRIYTDEGTVEPKKTKTTRMAEIKNAFELVSNAHTRIETVYAEHANSLKALATKARTALETIHKQVYSPSARETYSNEVRSLMNKLNAANRNKPLERQAQIIANKSVSSIRKANPHLDSDAIKKIKGQQLLYARTRIGAKKDEIEITDREWEAIQAGAVSHHRLVSILTNADLDALKQRAMPRHSRVMSTSRMSRARQMSELGYSRKEIADAIGVSLSTIENALK
jgi:DNA-binding CsgD family transcriptional regulator